MKRMGKTKEKIFNDLDKDHSGYLEPLDILNGLKNYLHVYLNREETNKLVQDLDDDHSGDIDFDEFNAKIETDNLGERT